MASTDDLLVYKIGVDVAAAGERRGGQAPTCWVWTAACHVRGDGVPREEPDADSLTGPFGRVDAAALGIELCAVRLPVGGVDGATHVGSLAWCVHIAVQRRRGARELAVVDDGATGARVQGHRICGA